MDAHGARLAQLCEAIERPDISDDQRWKAFDAFLKDSGIESVTYGILDKTSGTPADAPVHFRSTMPADWIAHYKDNRLDRHDHIVTDYRRGHRRLIYSGYELKDLIRPLAREEERLLHERGEAGFASGVSLPLPTPFANHVDAGVVLTTGLKGDEFLNLWREKAGEAVLAVHLFHHRYCRPFVRDKIGVQLSDREIECLQMSAAGLRTDAIAERLSLSSVTISFHTSNARKKLDVKTLPEAIAKALQYGLISL